MPNYFYLTILCVAIIVLIIQQICLFIKGKYYPYLGWNKEDSSRKRVFDIGLNIVALVSASILSFFHDDSELLIFVFSLLLLALVFSVSILNYLSYIKIKDPKIIRQTVALNLFFIAFLVLFIILRVNKVNLY